MKFKPGDYVIETVEDPESKPREVIASFTWGVWERIVLLSHGELEVYTAQDFELTSKPLQSGDWAIVPGVKTAKVVGIIVLDGIKQAILKRPDDSYYFIRELNTLTYDPRTD